ncbi:hypothetical protein HF1_00600 [Mycoplasma haemofelis str. Langford 1]|uniref:Uncharacterized protein n=1 Tax=Mycoplasma haemofelis (strain Langford 1) TaxID=941640 RepID=E8ZKA2_MYCHL|nr:hypothetical protein [Mycoplasma haemofelis]CBY92068.1 hypothetical protein HF1_00600 [Mycoplasma haemofelis str. Langford 1]
MAFWTKKLSSLYVSVVPVIAITGLSTYGVITKINLTPSIEHNYLARVQLNIKEPLTVGTTYLAKSVEGKTYNFQNSETLSKLVEETRSRLDSYYKKYKSEPVYVNVGKTSDDALELFLHFRTAKSDVNPNKLWLDNVRFHQLSIDRWGKTFNEDGTIKDNNNTLHRLVKWDDIGVSEMKLKTSEVFFDSYLEFNIFGKEIEKVEMLTMANKNKDKFKPDDGANNDWFVWMDKELLALRINYLLQTYVFNQEQVKTNISIQKIVGSEGSSTSETQKKDKKRIEENYSNMTSEEKKFIEDYISIFHNESKPISGMSNWTEVVQNVTNESSFVSSDKLNDIYNKFEQGKKDLTLFDGYLISKIPAGSEEWSRFFNLKKVEKKEDKEAPAPESDWELDGIQPISNYGEAKGKENDVIRIFVDRKISPKLNPTELHELLTKYSIRYFDLKIFDLEKGQSSKRLLWPNAVYSESSANKKNEILHVLDIENASQYGFTE